MSKYIKTKFIGVRYREHSTRKHGAAAADRYFFIRYKIEGKDKEEGAGWASEGMTAEKAFKLLSTIRDNIRLGVEPRSIAAMRLIAEAEQKAAAAERDKEAQRQISVTEYFEQHYEPQIKRTLKETSWKKEASLFKFWIQPIISNMPLVDVTFSQWDTILRTMDKSGLSQRTKEYAAGTLRRILRHAQDRGHDVKIPTAKQVGASAPKNNRRERVLTQEECTNILTALESKDIFAWRLVRFAMLTGCRVSEGFNLRWRDVDFTANTLRFGDTKNTETRILPMSPAIVIMLKEFGPGTPDGIVFPRKDGKPHVEAPSAFKSVVKELELNVGRGKRDRVTFHTIRHTTATRLAADKLDVRSLMDVMGWKQIAMAARYIHSEDATKQSAMTTLERALAQQPAKVINFSQEQKQAKA